MKYSNKIAAILLIVTELIIVCLLSGLANYVHTYPDDDKTDKAIGFNSVRYEYMMQVMMMLIVGMAYYASYMSKYAFSSLGFTLLFLMVAIQLGVLYETAIKSSDQIRILDICNGAALAFSLLLAMGGTMGRLTYLQMVVHLYLALGAAAFNKYLLQNVFYAVEAGGALSVYAFGSLFGVAVSFFLGENVIKARHKENEPIRLPTEERTYHSDTHSLMGALFTWVYFPAFHAAQCYSPLMQYRAILNTILSTAGASVGAIVTFGLLYLRSRPIAHGAQGAFVAGAVVMSALAPLQIVPGLAILYGTMASAVVVLLHKLLLARLWKYDSMRYSLAFLVPGLLSAIIVCFYIGRDKDLYKDDFKHIFPGEAEGKSKSVQIVLQIISILVTIGLSAGVGAITGILLRTKLFKRWPDPAEMYRDHYNFVLPRTID